MKSFPVVGRALCGVALALGTFACDVEEPEAEADGNGERIVGGVDTNITTVPWQISLQTTGGFHFCGGSIIDPEWVLTAAHCVSSSNGSPSSPSSMRVKAGVTNKNATGQLRNVSQIIIAPGWNGDTTDGHDAALLHLSSPLDLSGSTASAIELATVADGPDYAPGTLALVSGWGTLSPGGSSPTILQSVNVPIVSNAVAAAAYGSGNVTADQIAAGDTNNGGEDACQGDSGGPLIVNTASGPLLVGIVSWGQSCALAAYPGMYARVSSFVDWVDGELGGGNPPPPPPADSCAGNCGGNAGSCWCDDLCAQYGDCCPDKVAECDAPPPPDPTLSCDGNCGGNAGQCWCDSLCTQYGDCCEDFDDHC